MPVLVALQLQLQQVCDCTSTLRVVLGSTTDMVGLRARVLAGGVTTT